MEIKAAKRLMDALEAARRIQQFTVKLDFAQFSASELIRSGVERQFEIIGEALGKADAEDPGLVGKFPICRKSLGCATA